jgi:hypothetical protein
VVAFKRQTLDAYTLGDVLVSSRVHDFQVGAAIEDGPPEFQQQGGDVAVDVEKLLTHLSAIKGDLGGWSEEAVAIRAKPVEKLYARPKHRGERRDKPLASKWSRWSLQSGTLRGQRRCAGLHHTRNHRHRRLQACPSFTAALIKSGWLE